MAQLSQATGSIIRPILNGDLYLRHRNRFLLQNTTILLYYYNYQHMIVILMYYNVSSINLLLWVVLNDLCSL